MFERVFTRTIPFASTDASVTMSGLNTFHCNDAATPKPRSLNVLVLSVPAVPMCGFCTPIPSVGAAIRNAGQPTKSPRWHNAISFYAPVRRSQALVAKAEANRTQ